MTFSALLIAGTHSGCGKTTVALGVMAALARRGLVVQPFKCGPDFIDPSLHRMVAGRVSRNLDVRMCGVDWVRRTFACHSRNAGIGVVEGVMGLFDGGEGSAATLAKTLDLPVLLVADVRSAAESVAAVVHGFATLDAGVRLAGVICNGIGSDRHRKMVMEAVGSRCAVPVLGCLPRNEEVTIPSRHLGLHMGEEHPLTDPGLERLAGLIETHVDLDLLLRIAAAPRHEYLAPDGTAPVVRSPVVRIGLARDAAFCFYYEDNLDLLRAAGAELIPFSPLEDDCLPPGLDGLYLGGGYPELHADRLSDNRAMREQVRDFAVSGLPVYGECGGFMYLCRSITDLAGEEFPMAGVYPFAGRMQTRLSSLGYRQPQVVRDCLLGPAGTVLHGHEFHYSTIVGNNGPPQAAYVLDGDRAEGFMMHGATLAGYVHLHWGRTPEAAARFVAACRRTGDNTAETEKQRVPCCYGSAKKKTKILQKGSGCVVELSVHQSKRSGGRALCVNSAAQTESAKSVVTLQPIAPQDIEAESFRIIERELGPTRFSPEEFAVVRRAVHATGDFSFAGNFRFHPEAIASGLAAIRAGKNILVDVTMAASGISNTLLARFGGRVICRVAEPETAVLAETNGVTRSDAAMARSISDRVGIVAVGNAPTALLKVMDLIDQGLFTPDLIIGVPVGFVNAVESKELLAGKPYPFITALGRKGGTPVAVAVVNALLRLT